MAWQTGLVDVTSPALGHIRMLKHLQDFLRGAHVSAITINAAGTGYTLGDVVGLTGGTLYGDSAHAPKVEIVAVSSGVPTALRLVQSGSYVTIPTTLTGNAAIGGTGTGLTMNITMDHWATAVPAAAGTGYTVNDVLTLSGVTGTAPTFIVTTVSSGVVTAVKPATVGAATIMPVNPAATTGGTGTGCTLTVDRKGWLLNATTYTNDQTEFELQIQGRNYSGSDPYLGYRTGSAPGTGKRWQLSGNSGYNNALTFANQPGHSPVSASWETSSTTADDSILPLTDGDINFFFFANSRRVIAVAHIGTTYEFSYNGLFVPYVDDPATIYPLPLVTAGTISRANEDSTSSESIFHNILLRHDGANAQFLRDVGGVWRAPGTFAGAAAAWKLWPYMFDTKMTNQAEAFAPDISAGSGTLLPSDIVTGFDDGFFSSDAPTVSGYAPYGIGSRTYLCEPYILIQDEVGAVQVIGEIDGCFAIVGRGLTVEDLVQDQNGKQHQVFSNLNSTTLDDFFTIIRE